MRLGFRRHLPGGRSLCAERRLAGDTRGAKKRRQKKEKKKGKKKRKAERRKAPAKMKVSAERRRLIGEWRRCTERCQSETSVVSSMTVVADACPDKLMRCAGHPALEPRTRPQILDASACRFGAIERCPKSECTFITLLAGAGRHRKPRVLAVLCQEYLQKNGPVCRAPGACAALTCKPGNTSHHTSRR